MEDEVIDEVEKYIDGLYPELPFARGADIGRVIDYSAGRNRYIGYTYQPCNPSYKGMRVGLDCL